MLSLDDERGARAKVLAVGSGGVFFVGFRLFLDAAGSDGAALGGVDSGFKRSARHDG